MIEGNNVTRLRVGLVHNWPGARNSELDIILRIIPLLKSFGHNGIIIDPMGQELDDSGDRISPPIAHDNFDLVLNLHYLNPKMLSGLSYVVNWNPLAYIIDNPITKKPLPIKQFNFIADAFRSHDRVLTAGSTLVDNYVHNLRGASQSTQLADINLPLHTTITAPENVEEIKVNAEGARVFYIGVNWEKLSQNKDKQVRHEGLFEILDQSDEFVFYGLKQQYGIELWEGIENYKGELPFDGGKSIIDVSRQCGITLVLSSEQHRASGLVSTRVFQACAAGTVILSDRNSFLETHFGANIYYFDYGNTAQDTARNILKAVGEIKSDWPTAVARAQYCQQHFLNSFTLDKEIASICEQAKQDLKVNNNLATTLQVANTLSIFCDARNFSFEELHIAYKQFCKQRVLPNNVFLVVNTKQNSNIQGWLSEQPRDVATRLIVSDATFGGVLNQYLDSFCEHVMFYTPNTIWNADHTFQLLAMVTEQAPIVYSPTFVEYTNLLSAHETSEYCIKGLDGGVLKIDENALQRFSVTAFNNANILVSKHILTDNKALRQKLPYFDMGAVFIIIYEHWLYTKSLPLPSFSVTSKWPTKRHYGDLTFNQYSASHVPLALYRDRNMFSALYGHANAFVSERISAWELQQEQELARHDVSTEYEIDALRANLGGISSDVSGLTEKFDSGDFSRQFSLFVYLKHLLRNRPIALSVISKLHRLFAKALKI